MKNKKQFVINRWSWMGCAAILVAVGLTYFTLKSDLRKTYYETGELKQTVPLRKGVEHGTVREFYKNGAIKLESNFVNGVQDGLSTFYFENGNIERKVYFKKGEQTDTMKLFYENGNVREISFVQHGKKTGLFQYYASDGRLVESGTLQNNLKTGNWIDAWGAVIEEFYDNGTLISKFKDGYYEHADGYALRVPDGWIKAISKKDAAAFGPPDKLNDDSVTLVESITILSKEIPDSLNFPAIIDLELNATMNQVRGFRVISKQYSQLAYEKRVVIIYEGTMGTIDVTARLMLSLKGDQLVVVSCLAPSSIYNSEFKLTSDRVISSFVFKDLEPDA